MEVEWDTRQKEFRSWAKAADTTAARDRDERAPRGPSSVPNGQDASVHVHPDTLILPASYLLPPLWFKTKTIKTFRQLIVRFWEFFVFVSFSPQQHLFSPCLSSRAWGEGCSSASPGPRPGGPDPAQEPGSQSSLRPEDGTEMQPGADGPPKESTGLGIQPCL